MFDSGTCSGTHHNRSRCASWRRSLDWTAGCLRRCHRADDWAKMASDGIPVEVRRWRRRRWYGYEKESFLVDMTMLALPDDWMVRWVWHTIVAVNYCYLTDTSHFVTRWLWDTGNSNDEWYILAMIHIRVIRLNVLETPLRLCRNKKKEKTIYQLNVPGVTHSPIPPIDQLTNWTGRISR